MVNKSNPEPVTQEVKHSAALTIAWCKTWTLPRDFWIWSGGTSDVLGAYAQRKYSRQEIDAKMDGWVPLVMPEALRRLQEFKKSGTSLEERIFFEGKKDGGPFEAVCDIAGRDVSHRTYLQKHKLGLYAIGSLEKEYLDKSRIEYEEWKKTGGDRQLLLLDSLVVPEPIRFPPSYKELTTLGNHASYGVRAARLVIHGYATKVVVTTVFRAVKMYGVDGK